MDRVFPLLAGCALLLASGIGHAQPSPPEAQDQPAADQAASAQLPPLPLPPPLVRPPAPAPVEKPAKLEHMQKAQAEGILGETVLNAKGEPIGRIVNVLVNVHGTPHAAVIQFAGFLGVGNRDIAVVWNALDFKVADNHIVITVDLNAEKLKAMPTYTADAKSVPVAAPAKAKPPATKAKAAVPAVGHEGETAPAGAR